jgi:hypothetical protein
LTLAAMHNLEHDPIHMPKSYLQWHFDSLGLPTLLLIVGVSLLAMTLIIVLFLRGRGPGVPAAILFILPMPLVVGLVCLLGGSITYLSQLAAGQGQRMDAFAYGLTAATQASSCFCPLLILSLVLMMVLGFRHQGKG